MNNNLQDMYNKYEYIAYSQVNKVLKGHKLCNDYEDMIQSMKLELWEALLRYNPDKYKDTKIETYLTECIKLRLKTYIMKERNKTGSIPRNHYKVSLLIYNNKDELTLREMYEKCLKDISENISYESFMYIYNQSRGNISLDETTADTEYFWHEVIEDKNVDIENEVISNIIIKDIINKVKSLDISERNLDIYMTFLNSYLSNNYMSFNDIGDIYNVSRQRIHQIICSINEKLRG